MLTSASLWDTIDMTLRIMRQYAIPSGVELQRPQRFDTAARESEGPLEYPSPQCGTREGPNRIRGRFRADAVAVLHA